ncbi:MAG: pyridoxal phosphate-dependent aminotransferase [Bacteroidaceae bacterium]|nr:pyridoxal phosphate-dependent aminotransferase [Bacteroidaceae bacterium]
MKRRAFLKNVMAAGATSVVAPSALLTMTGCGSQPTPETIATPKGFDFDEIIDRSGTFSMKHGRAEKMGGGKIAMGMADMDFRTAPHVHDALAKRIERDVLGYTAIPDEYYTAIQKWTKEQQGWEMDREWINYCPGVITSYTFAIECFSQPGDKVIVQPPVYDPFVRYSKGIGREVVDNPLILEDGKYRMDFEQLESLMDDRTKLMVLCNPHNPGGMMWDADSLRRLAEICARHGVLVLSDEIHGDLALNGRRHVPFCSVSEEAANIGVIFTGPTKAFNLAGIHTAQCYIVNPELRKKYTAYLRDRKLTEASLPAIIMTLAAYGGSDEWLNALKKYLQANVDLVAEFIAKEIPAIKVHRPEASFLIWLDCRALGLEQKDLVAMFQDKANLVINNGASYGQGGEGFIRINIGCPRSVVEKALQQLKSAVQQTV